VSALVASELNHPASRRWLAERDRAGEILVAPTLLIPEVAAAIARRSGRSTLGKRAVAALLRLPNLRIVDLDAELAEEAGQIAANRRLRGADAVYVALARRLEIALVSWDQEQVERARGLVEIVEP